MNETLIRKLKKVRWNDIIHIFKFLLAWPIGQFYKRIRKDMWLLCEYETEARDNAYYLFRYLKEKQPQVDAVYAIKKGSRDYYRVCGLGEIVSYGSLKHWIYYIAARVNISSQKGGKPNAAVCYLLEVSGIWKNIRVFLQHGVIKDDLPFLHYCNTKMRLFSCAALPEYFFVRDTFGYPEGYVQYLGLCRFDALYKAKANSEIILIIPTWRNYLYDLVLKSDEDAFKETIYYKSWGSLIANERLGALLQRHQKRIIFCLHRNMQSFSGIFSSQDSRINILQWENTDITALIHTASMLITDYSSIFMDFAYMERPVLYYQFDYQEFRKGHLPNGYFDYSQNGFGPVCIDQDKLIMELEKILYNQCKMEPMYVERKQQFFTLCDDKNCERTYYAIQGVCEE